MNYEDLQIEYITAFLNELCKLADKHGKDRDETIRNVAEKLMMTAKLATFAKYEITEGN